MTEESLSHLATETLKLKEFRALVAALKLKPNSPILITANSNERGVL